MAAYNEIIERKGDGFMKTALNTLAFILIIGFVGSWECGNTDFRGLLFNCGVVLAILLSAYSYRGFRIFLRRCRMTKREQYKKLVSRDFNFVEN